jgi:acyl carrier protein
MAATMLEADAVTAWMKRYVDERLGAVPDDLSVHTNFASLGFDSVDGVIMADRLETDLGVPCDPALFLRNTDLAGVIAELQSSGVIAGGS